MVTFCPKSKMLIYCLPRRLRRVTQRRRKEVTRLVEAPVIAVLIMRGLRVHIWLVIIETISPETQSAKVNHNCPIYRKMTGVEVIPITDLLKHNFSQNMVSASRTSCH